MAIYTNLEAVETGMHGLFRSSRLKSSDTGKLYDLIVRDASNKEIAVDNGTAVKVGPVTHDGFQTRYATIAKVGDQIAVTGSPAIVKTAMTKAQADERNFYVPAGKPVKAYEVLPVAGEIFGVAEYQFTTVLNSETKKVAEDSLVVVDGNGGWKELATNAAVTSYGFVGKVYGFEEGDNVRIVLIECVKNAQV